MAKLAGTEVISFQRKPTYIYYRMPPSKLLGRPNISGNPEYTEDDKRRFRENPEEHKAHRRMLVHRINRAFKMVRCPRTFTTAIADITSLSKTHLNPKKHPT